MPKSKQEPTVPFSIRLTVAEHAQLKRLSGGMSMAAYARETLLGEQVSEREIRSRSPAADRVLLAQLLAMLGQCDLAERLLDLAQAARMGPAPLPPELETQVLSAYMEVISMKTMLMQALGIQED